MSNFIRPSRVRGTRSDNVSRLFIERHAAPEPGTIEHIKCAVLYARTSLEGAAEKSIPSQLAEINDYCLKGSIKVHNSYQDVGISGMTRVGRVGLEAALEDIRSGKANILMAYDVARLSRTEPDQWYIWGVVESANAELHIHGHGKVSREAFHILCIAARMYRETFLAQSERGRRQAVEAGRVPHHTTFGYTRDPFRPGEHFPHPKLALVVKEIFDLLEQGVSTMVIARSLTGRVPTPRQCISMNSKNPNEDFEKWPSSQFRPWLPHMVRKVATNVIYYGVVIYGKTKKKRDPNRFESVRTERTPESTWVGGKEIVDRLEIVSRDQFERVGLIISSRGFADTRKKPRGSEFLLTNKVFCSKCDSRMMALGRSYSEHPLYVCEASALDSESCTGSGRHRVARIEKIVNFVISEYILTEENVNSYRDEVTKHIKDLDKERDIKLHKLRAKRDSIRENFDATMDVEFVRGIPAAMVQEKRRNLSESLSKVEDDLATLLARKSFDNGFDNLLDLKASLTDIAEKAPFRSETPEGMRLMDAFRDLVDSVSIGEISDEAKSTVSVFIDLRAFFPHLDVDGDCEENIVEHKVIYDFAQDKADLSIDERKKSADLLQEQAESETYKITSDMWDLIDPIITQKCSEIREKFLEYRKIMEGVFFILRSGTPFTKLPPVFGDRDELVDFLKAIVWAHAWDAIVESICQNFPTYSRVDLTDRLNNSMWKRNPYKGKVMSNLPTQEELLKAAAEENDPFSKRRLEAIAQVEGGATYAEVGKKIGVSLSSICVWNAKFKRGGIPLLTEKPKKRPREVRLNPDQVQKIKDIVDKAVDPKDCSKKLRWSHLVLYCKEEFHLEIKVGVLRVNMKKVGIPVLDVRRATLNAAIRARSKGNADDMNDKIPKTGS